MEIQERSNPPAQSSKTGGGGPGSVPDEPNGRQKPGDGAKDRSSAPAGAGKGSDRNGPQGGQGDGSGGPQTAPGAVQTGSTSDDGSSPLVPILIAIAVLAAISIGAVLMRQRRRDDEPGVPVSPKAG